MELEEIIYGAPAEIKKEFKERFYKKGSNIILSDEENEYLYILVEGSAEVYRQNYSGTMLTLHRYEPYSCFGEMELFNEDVKTRSIIAISDCRAILIQKGVVYRWMKSDFEFNLYLIKQLVLKLISSSEISSRLSFLSVKERVIFSIHTHYRIGDLSRFTKKMLQAEVCAPLRSINRSIAECYDEGLFEYNRKRFNIFSQEKFSEEMDRLLI